MGSLVFNRAEMDAVAVRNGSTTTLDYLTKILKLNSATDDVANFNNAVSTAASQLRSFFQHTYSPAKVSASEIKLTNSGGDYITFKGANFGPITSTGTLATKFTSLRQAVETFDGNDNATLSSITFGHGSTVRASATLTGSKLSVTTGKASVTIDGQFPTSLGDIYTAIDQMTGLDQAHPKPNPQTFKFLAIPSTSELFNYDLNKITVKYDGATIATATFTDTKVIVTSEGVTMTATGSFPDKFGEVYNAIVGGLAYDRAGHPAGTYPTIKLLQTLAANADAHHYDLDSIVIKKGTTVLASATLAETSITVTIGDLKLIAKGTFPHTAADFMELLADLTAGQSATLDLSITSLQLIDTDDNSLLAHANNLSGADGIRALSTIGAALVGLNAFHLTSGSDRFVGTKASEYVYGGTGNDTLLGGAGGDQLSGGDGNDSISGGDNQDYISGGANNDFLDGGNQNDELDGGAGNDTILGGGNNDTIWGGSGQDSLAGGSGADKFVFRLLTDSKLATLDVITDFGVTDRLEIEDYDSTQFVLDAGGPFVKYEIRQIDLGNDLRLEFNLNNDANAEAAVLIRNHDKFTSIDDLIA